MKQLAIICLSLSVLSGGLKFNKLPVGHRSGNLNAYLLKKTKKEIFKYSMVTNPLCTALDNSLHFITCGFNGKTLPF